MWSQRVEGYGPIVTIPEEAFGPLQTSFEDPCTKEDVHQTQEGSFTERWIFRCFARTCSWCLGSSTVLEEDGQEDQGQDGELPAHAGKIIPAGAEGEEYDQNISYLFNDSLNIFLASAVNESQIVTILTDDSVNMSTTEANVVQVQMEEIPEVQEEAPAAIPDGMPDEDELRILFHLDLNRFM